VGEQKIQYRVHKISPFNCILSQFSPVPHLYILFLQY
jgi:hypothetical protein